MKKGLVLGGRIHVFGLSKTTLIIIGVAALVLIAFAVGKDHGPIASGSGCTMTVSADVLNVRDAPAASGNVVGRLERGARTNVQPTVQDGYRKLGEGHWASQEFLTPAAGKC